MGNRITIILDDAGLRKAHNRQARKIRDTMKTVSLSSIINEMVTEAKG